MNESDAFQARLLNIKNVEDTFDYDIGYENGRKWAARIATASDLAALGTMCRNGKGEYGLVDLYEALYGVNAIPYAETLDENFTRTDEYLDQQSAISDIVTMVAIDCDDIEAGAEAASGVASYAMIKGFLEAVLQVKAHKAANR
ncbi:MAG: hypothetical protein ABSD90_14835 [Methylocystis sp.]|jgi:hypothetical protein